MDQHLNFTIEMSLRNSSLLTHGLKYHNYIISDYNLHSNFELCSCVLKTLLEAFVCTVS